MASDWAQVPIGEVCEGIFDGPHATPPKTNSGPVFLGIWNLVNGRVNLSQTEHVDDEYFKKWTRRVTPRAGDLVFSYETRLGDCAMIPEGLTCCLGRRMALARPDPDKIYPRYLIYAFLGPEFQETIRKHTVRGSTVDRIPLLEFPKFPIRLPLRSEQEAIADTLSALDDKIAQNAETVSSLERLARATFKAWLVDFEPVKAKAAGQTSFPGMPAATFAALPDCLTDSSTGRVPQGWDVGTVADICTRITSGGTPKTEEPRYWGGDLRWLSSGETGSTYIIDTEKKITEAGADESGTRLIRAGSTVIASAGQGKTRGQTSLLFVDCYINQSVLALEANDRVTDTFLFLCLKPQYEELRRISDAHSSRGSLTKQLVGGISLTVPPPAVMKSWDAIVSPMFEMIRSLTVETSRLAVLRDYLLPRLMSGRIRVGTINA